MTDKPLRAIYQDDTTFTGANRHGDLLCLTLEGGKYHLVQDQTGKQFALRYGAHWRDLAGDQLILVMGQEIERLRTTNNNI